MRMPLLNLALGMALLLHALPVCAAAGQAKDDAPPIDPPAEAINVELLEQASRTAVRNGIASVLARIEVNDGLVVPLADASRRGAVAKVVEKTYRYREEVREVERPIRKKVGEREVRQPITDEYGNITGYKTVRVPIYRTVGTKTVQVKVLVRDDNGPIERTRRHTVYERDPISHVPRGTLGANAMGLYVLRKAGLKDEAARLADKLRLTVAVTGLPDGTWDLSWMVAAYAGLEGGRNRELYARLVSKLIDGQVRARGPAQGMWGPLCIHHEALAGYLSLETRIFQESQRIEKELAAARNPDPRLEREKKTIDELRDQIRKALDDTGTQGNAYSMYSRAYQVRDNVYLAGLPYYFYNHTVADLDSTYMATWALAVAAEQDALPEKTTRWPIRRKTPAPSEDTRKTLRLAQRTVFELMAEGGRWTPSHRVIENRAYARYPELELANIGPTSIPNPLLERETWRSNLRGLAAVLHTNAAVQKTEVARDEALADAYGNARVIVKQLLGSDSHWIPTRTAGHQRFPNRAPDYHAFHGTSFKLKDLADPAQRQSLFVLPDRSIDQLPAGYTSEPYTLLPMLAAIFGEGGGSEAESKRTVDLYDLLTYRLLIEQRDDGQWHDSGFAAEVPSSLFSYAVQADLEKQIVAAMKNPNPNNRKRLEQEIDLSREMMQSVVRLGGGVRRIDHAHTYATLASMAFLLERLEQPIDMSGATILTAELQERLNPFADELIDEPAEVPAEEDAPAEPEKQAKPLTAGEAASTVVRVNEDLGPLLDALKSAQ